MEPGTRVRWKGKEGVVIANDRIEFVHPETGEEGIEVKWLKEMGGGIFFEEELEVIDE